MGIILKNLNVCSLLSLSTLADAKCYPTMIQLRARELSMCGPARNDASLPATGAKRGLGDCPLSR